MSASRFRVRTLALCAAVAVAAGSLAAASALQPPKLTALEFSPAALTDTDTARVVLRFTQTVREVQPADVTLTPSVAHTVSTDGAAVTVRLSERIDYGAKIRVELRVASAATGSVADVTRAVAAQDIRVRTLVRDDAGDRIVSNDLVGGARPREIQTNRRVQEYAGLDGRVFTVTDAGGGAVELGEFGGGERPYTPLIPAELGSLTQLRADTTGKFIGVVASGIELAGRQTENELLVMDARSGVAPPVTVSGSDGIPLRVRDWRFVPGGIGVAVLDEDGELWLATPALGRDPVPLGPADGIVGFLPDTGELVADLSGVARAIDVSGLVSGGAGSEREARVVERHLPGEVFTAGGGRVARSGDAHRLLLMIDGAGQEVFAPTHSGTRIGAICPAPNGSVVAVELISAGAEPDARPVLPAFRGTTTVYIDAHGGELRSSIGFAPDWC